MEAPRSATLFSMKLPSIVALLLVLLVVFTAARRLMKPTAASTAEEQALIVTLKLTDADDTERIHTLEDRLSTAIKKASAGEFDGDEFGKGVCTLYMYGPDAELLYRTTIQILREYQPAKGSYLIKRFGKPRAK